MPLRLAVSLAFAAFVVVLPELAQEPTTLRAVCYVAAALPFGSFLGFAVLGVSDRRLILGALEVAEATSRGHIPSTADGPPGPVLPS